MTRIHPLVSIVVPVFNEESTLPEFFRRTIQTLSLFPFEIIFVNDGSQDRSWALIQDLSEKDKRISGISLSRNFGHQAALSAGLEHTKGDSVVLIDCDLQDPPELIPEMIKKWQEGFDVVYGVRSERKGEGFLKKITASLFYYCLLKTTNLNVPLETGDFRLLSRKVVDSLNQLPERIRFVRGLITWIGFRQIGIPYSREKRYAGQTKYSWARMFKFAFDGLTSFSRIPLQLASILGLVVTATSFVVALYSLYIRLFTNTAVKGWTSLLVVIVFLGGVQLLMVGIIGEYIGRIYEEVKHRPLYLIQKKVGFAEE